MVSVGDRDVESHMTSRTTLSGKQMGSTAFGAAVSPSGRRVAPQHIEIDRGKSGRVRLSDRIERIA
jgi:hypothetical protein